MGPCAYVDVGPERPSRLDGNLKLLTELVFKLEKKTYRWPRRLRFSRFRLGLLALGADLSDTDRPEALADLSRILRGDDDGEDTRRDEQDGAQDFDSAVAAAAEVVRALGAPVPPGVAQIVQIVLRRLTPKTVDRFSRRGALRWHAENADPQCANGYEALVELHHLKRDGHDEQVEELLCRAFVADVQAAYNSEVFSWDRGAKCLLLLDNADRRLGEPFRELLERVREDMAADSQAGPSHDSLVLVMTTRAPVRSVEAAVPSTEVAKKVAVGLGPATGRALPVRLDDLQVEDVRALTRGRRGMPRSRGGDFAHLLAMLTRGHPGSTALLVDAVEAAARGSAPGLNDARLLLDLPGATRQGTPAASVADQILDLFLADQPPEVRQALITCAPALSPVAANALAGVGGLTQAAVRKMHDVLTTELWPLPLSETEIPARTGMLKDPSRPGKPDHVLDRDHRLVGQRMVWRVLMHRLAARPAGAEDEWRSVHERLRDHHSARGETLAMLHHSLALGDLATVAAHFDGTFTATTDSGRPDDWVTWFDDLRYVVRSLDRPRARPVPGAPSPGQQAIDLAREIGEPEPRQLVARLTAALLIYADPLGDPAYELGEVIEDALRDLSFRAGSGFDHLNTLARSFAAGDVHPDQI
ncbi:hypothetical protein SMC26_00780 [Actinomadura fulvescens]|uniref:ATP-binding protein n=1 Tax=Actinomadura fulvescens TaxID=46160 RepID=A0ABP6C6B9_9ACTN